MVLLKNGFGNARGSGALILLYHRVNELPSDPQLLAVTREHFNDHLEFLARYAHPLSLSELVRAISSDQIPPRAVAVTFDDGYADNLYHAKPLLEQFGIPAAFFVTAGSIDQEQRFWWDELDQLLLQSTVPHEELRLEINGKVYRWKLGKTGHLKDRQTNKVWNIQQNSDPGPWHKCYRELCQLLRPLPRVSQEEVIAELRSWVGAVSGDARDYRTLSTYELKQLAAGDLFEVGAHSMTHPVLSKISASEQLAEIEGSKNRLNSILGRPVTSFAYPYGTKSDYTEETVGIVQTAGFHCALSNFSGVIDRKADRFQLPRFLVRNWPGKEFNRYFQSWFND